MRTVKQALDAVYAEIRRVDELGSAESRRIDGIFQSHEKAVSAALNAAEKAVAAALAASEKAVNKAEVAQANVNATQNEFRGTLRDQAGSFMPRSEAENTFRELRGLIATQSETIATLRSRLDIGPPSLATLQTRSDEQSGRAAQGQQDWLKLSAVIGFTIAGFGIVVGILIKLLA